VVVKPNRALVQPTLTMADAKALMEMWKGSAISKRTMYENLQKADIASKERSLEEEEDLINDEMPPPAPPIPLGPDGTPRELTGHSLNKAPSDELIANFKKAKSKSDKSSPFRKKPEDKKKKPANEAA
jgi:hypothetical protein